MTKEIMDKAAKALASARLLLEAGDSDGAIILTFAPGVLVRRQFGDPGRREKPLLWCFGATLNHVLPVVTLSPELTDFFNDPKGDRLYSWQKVAFAVLALCGWALSFFVIAAISGLTQT